MREDRIKKLREETGGTYESLGMRALASELDYRDGRQEDRWDVWGTSERLNEYKEKISVGQPMEEIGKLGGLDRQLLQEDAFFAVGRAVYKKLSAEEELDRLSLDYSKVPERLKAQLLRLVEEDANIGSLMLAIRQNAQRPDVLEWLADNWQEYVEQPEPDIELDASPKTEDDIPDPCSVQEQPNATHVREKLPRPPKDSYAVVEVFKPSRFKEASERRIAHLKARLYEIHELYSLSEIETYLSSIHPTYQEDKELLAAWSESRRTEDRAHYLHWLRRQGLDFESIRRKMWATFDRETGDQVLAVEVTRPLKANWVSLYGRGSPSDIEDPSKEATTIPTSVKKIPPPIWELERSKALCSLNQTRSQWGKVYQALYERLGLAIVALAKAAITGSQKDQVHFLLLRYGKKINKEHLSEATVLIYGEDACAM